MIKLVILLQYLFSGNINTGYIVLDGEIGDFNLVISDQDSKSIIKNLQITISKY